MSRMQKTELKNLHFSMKYLQNTKRQNSHRITVRGEKLNLIDKRPLNALVLGHDLIQLVYSKITMHDPRCARVFSCRIEQMLDFTSFFVNIANENAMASEHFVVGRD